MRKKRNKIENRRKINIFQIVAEGILGKTEFENEYSETGT